MPESLPRRIVAAIRRWMEEGRRLDAIRRREEWWRDRDSGGVPKPRKDHGDGGGTPY